MTVRARWNGIAGALERILPFDLALLACRLGVAAVFWQSGRTKVEGVLSVTDGAVALFRDEYRLPLIDPAVAAHLAAWGEHALPLLLAAGLFTRGAALGLLGMALVIQVFVYPSAWPTHLAWAGPLLVLAARGGGAWSADRVVGLR